MPVEEVSKITAKGQATIPKAVRKALGVSYGGRVAFRVERGQVTIRRVDEDERDPAIGRFLAFLARDMERRPEGLSDIDVGLGERLTGLTGAAEVDLDAPIEGEVDL